MIIKMIKFGSWKKYTLGSIEEEFITSVDLEGTE